jgi:hypothetical protein
MMITGSGRARGGFRQPRHAKARQAEEDYTATLLYHGAIAVEIQPLRDVPNPSGVYVDCHF